jgi:hypothetical protein
MKQKIASSFRATLGRVPRRSTFCAQVDGQRRELELSRTGKLSLDGRSPTLDQRAQLAIGIARQLQSEDARIADRDFLLRLLGFLPRNGLQIGVTLATLDLWTNRSETATLRGTLYGLNLHGTVAPPAYLIALSEAVSVPMTLRGRKSSPSGLRFAATGLPEPVGVLRDAILHSRL